MLTVLGDAVNLLVTAVIVGPCPHSDTKPVKKVQKQRRRGQCYKHLCSVGLFGPSCVVHFIRFEADPRLISPLPLSPLPPSLPPPSLPLSAVVSSLYLSIKLKKAEHYEADPLCC